VTGSKKMMEVDQNLYGITGNIIVISAPLKPVVC